MGSGCRSLKKEGVRWPTACNHRYTHLQVTTLHLYCNRSSQSFSVNIGLLVCFIILIDTDGIVDGLNSMKWEWNTSSIWDVSAMVFLEGQRTTSPWWYIFACNFKGWAGAFWHHLFGPCLIFFSTDHCYLSVGSNILTGNQNGSGCVWRPKHEVQPFASCRRMLWLHESWLRAYSCWSFGLHLPFMCRLLCGSISTKYG